MRVYLLILGIFLCYPSFAQVSTKISIDNKPIFFSKSTSTPPTVNLPKLDIDKLIKEDEEERERGNIILPRFGKDVDVNYSLSNSGNWEEVERGKLWKLEILSAGALSLNLMFDRFFLSEGAELNIYNRDKTIVIGPITNKENNNRRAFSSDIIRGEAITLELFVPGSVEQTELRINKVIHGYSNLFNTNFPGVPPGFGKSAPCNVDVKCQVGLPWEVETNSVAMILLSNNTCICTGALLNNACQNFTPYFLTAFHCVDSNNDGILQPSEITAAEDWVFRFQYKSPSCGGPDATSWHSFNGADFKAAWNITDFALFELDQSPISSTGITYAGWSRGDTPPA